MPSRKSDARRSDVSVSRIVVADEDSPMTHDAAASGPAAPTSSDAQTTGTSLPALNQQSTPETKSMEKDKDKEKDRDTVSIEDLNLPKSIITRLAKGVLPPNTQIQANAILALSKSATVFISHLASASNEFTLSANKKTIMPADVFAALDEIEYGFMRERLEAEFAKFNDIQTSKRSNYRKKVAAAKKGVPGDGAADSSMLSTTSATTTAASPRGPPAGSGGEVGAGATAPPAAKKARVDPSRSAGDEGEQSRMEVDGEREMSDAETVPDEQEEDDDDDDDDEEEEEEDEEDSDDAEDADGLEVREARESGDEALDDGDSE